MFVFDTSAVVALFRNHPYALTRWNLANEGQATVVLPVGAMLDAAQQVGVSASAWEAVLIPPDVEVHPLSETVAVEIGDQPGPLGARHALWEARYLGWPIVTGEPGLYSAGTPLLTF